MDAPDLTPQDLTPHQVAEWEETMSLMTWTCPGFQSLFYKLLAPERNGKYHAVMSAGIPIAATDATSIILNPARFFKYNLSERAFIIAHEVGHNMYADVEYIQHC